MFNKRMCNRIRSWYIYRSPIKRFAIHIIHILGIDLNNQVIEEGGVVEEILKAYQENNSHLTRLQIEHADLRNGGDRLVATTLNSCTNLKQISIRNSNISDEHILPIVQALTGHSSLETLTLSRNRIGNAGCVNNCYSS